MTQCVLVTGGAGYIGSHTCKQFAQAGLEPVAYDNLSRGHRHNVKWGPLVVGDILDGEQLRQTFRRYRPEAVIHFAASAYVGESVLNPALYYRNNVQGSLELLEAMRAAQVPALVFSSTCATYGVPENVPISEATPQHPINPYGRSKLMVERILDDFSRAYGLRYAVLRYFNACGADPDGELAEEHDPEPHLIPRCLQAAVGRIEAVEIFGDDYPTPDGSCIRDYVHVSDLAAAHLDALGRLDDRHPVLTLNLGTGHGLSVHDILRGVREHLGREVPYVVRPRRPGDPPVLVADGSLARTAIGFVPQFSDLRTIINTAEHGRILAASRQL